jgi:hypothetical protein
MSMQGTKTKATTNKEQRKNGKASNSSKEVVGLVEDGGAGDSNNDNDNDDDESSFSISHPPEVGRTQREARGSRTAPDSPTATTPAD